jgi:AcrR family transcriptional regulator
MSEATGSVPLREQQRAFTRSKLMESAKQVFAARGFPDATVDDIAREAGASRATFYLHFRNKTHLAAALVDDARPFAVSRYHKLDAMLCEGGQQLREQLHLWLSQWLEIWAARAEASHALLQAAMLEPDVEAHRLQISVALIDALECYLGQMPEGDRQAVRERALVLEIMTQQIFALASMRQLPVGDEEMLVILVGMWYQTLVEDAPPRANARRR